MAAELVQIYYDESQLQHLYPFAKPYFNKSLTIFFENTVIKEVVMSSNAKNVAVCSWKLKSKLRYNVPGPVSARPITQELIDGDFEVLSFTRNSPKHEMLEAANVWHPGFIEVFDKMLSSIGVKRPLSIKHPINQNHFCARNDIYKDYVTRYLTPAMTALETMPEASRDSGYSKLIGQPASEEMVKKIGLPYYPLAPFLLERLFSVYVQNEGIRVEYL